MRKYLLFLTNFLVVISHAQNPPPEAFLRAIDLIGKNNQLAKIELKQLAEIDTTFHGTFHFLGVLAMYENKNDSAIIYLKRSIALNHDNINHTREFSIVRLIRAYLHNLDFENSFDVAWRGISAYPDNKEILYNLRECCLWAYSIKVNNLNPEYLSSTGIMGEYLVNAVYEEYLILGNININDARLQMNSQSLVKKKGKYYDILNCTRTDTHENIDLNFGLNWNIHKYYGGYTPNTTETYEYEKNPVYLRIGGLIAEKQEADIIDEIKKIKKD